RVLRDRLRHPRRGARDRARTGPRRNRPARGAAVAPVPARELRRVTDLAWFDAVLRAARPQAIGALLRYFRDLDQAEEAVQEPSLHALKNWPVNGPPRDPAAWLIMVGRNAALDEVRRRSKNEALPADDVISDLDDREADLAERLDSSHYRDDVLRLLFISCH